MEEAEGIKIEDVNTVDDLKSSMLLHWRTQLLMNHDLHLIQSQSPMKEVYYIPSMPIMHGYDDAIEDHQAGQWE